MLPVPPPPAELLLQDAGANPSMQSYIEGSAKEQDSSATHYGQAQESAVDAFLCRRRNDRKPDSVIKLCFRLSWWLFSQSLEIEVQRTTRGWTVQLNPCRIVPHDTEFFKACQQGDVVLARQLLSDQKASLYDMCPDGLNALTVRLPSSKRTIANC